MPIQIIVLAFVTFCNVVLSIIVLKQNYKKGINISYAIFVLGISLWSATNALFQITNSYNQAFFYANVSYVSAIIMVASLLYFSFYFPRNLERKNFISKNFNTINIIFGGILIILIWIPDFILIGVNITQTERSLITNNGLFLYAVYLLLNLIFILRNLYISYRKSQGLQKNQIRFVILGLFTLILFGLISNLILPLLGIYSLIWLGPDFSIFMLVTFAYAIVRYRLMNIRFIITRSLVFLLLVGIVSTIFVFASYLTASYFQQTGINQYLIWVVISLIIVLGIDPLKNVFARITDNIFYKGKLDYAFILKKLSNLINEELELTSLVQHFRLELEEELKLQHADVLLQMEDSDLFLPLEYYYQHPKQLLKKQVSADLKPYYNSAAVKYLMKEQTTIVTDEFDRFVYDLNNEVVKKRLQKVLADLEKLQAAVMVPVIRNDKLKAFILVGKKVSGETFSDEDINLLEVLAAQFAAALDRSKLYEEVQAFNIKLQKEVDKATKDLQDVNTQLQNANQHLQELDKAKSEFMSIASHQLRTPLTGIVGYLSMIREGDYGKVEDGQRQVIDDVFQASQRLVRLVNTFLNVTRIEAGRFTLTFVNTDLRGLIEAHVKEMLPTATKKGLELIFNKPEEPMEVMVDDKIREVILNLIDNAIKYTQKGKVVVNVEKQGKTKMHFWVKDTGVGIRPEDAKELFQKFVRGSKIAQIQPNGSGLGLYIVRRIVEGHKGKVWAESSGEGKGSTFHVELPIKQRTAEYKADAEELFETTA